MIRTNFHKYNLKDWLKMPIESENGFEKDHINSEYITHQDFVDNVYDAILKILENNKYHIGNKKRYKKELTNILYSLSDNSSYGPL
jgi:hypothetical protein